MYVRPWGFQLRDISSEIKLWYGLYDSQVPIGMGRYLAKELPRADLKEVEVVVIFLPSTTIFLKEEERGSCQEPRSWAN